MVEAVLVEADLVEEDFAVVFAEDLDLRPLVDLVLKGFATGARFISPFAVVFGAGCFLDVSAVSSAWDGSPAEVARRSAAVARRRSSIYCTPTGLAALFCWSEVWEMAGGESLFCEAG